MSETITIIPSRAEFDDKSSKGTVLIDFFAPWCGPCRMQLPILEEVAKKVGSAVAIYKVNTDELSDVAAQFDVASIPTLVLLQNGNVVQRFVGLQQEETLIAAIKNVP